MDINALRSRITATLDPNADTRRQAELDLKQAETQPGFTNALLDILQSDSDHGVQISAGVYLKHRVTRGWKEEPAYADQLIPDSEKESFRNRLVPIISTVRPQVRAQLIPILQRIIQCDFPEKWPTFVDMTVQLLSTNEATSVFAGLLCLLALCRVYRYKSGDNRSDFDKIVMVTFGPVLAIGNGLLEETSNDAGEMLKLVMKSYKHAIQFELPAPFKSQESVLAWCSLFVRVVTKDPPPDAMLEDLDERQQNEWWKSKKWAYANLNRLFVRYGNPNSLTGNDAGDSEFSKNFITKLAPEILQAYLGQVEKWVAKTAWLSKPCLSSTIAFLDECVKPHATWVHLKPHIDSLISHVIFPILCQTDEDIEQFEDDPTEYLNRRLNYYEEVLAPDASASSFLVTLTKSRKKQTFPIIKFINTIVTKYDEAPEEERNPREKDGALRLIGTLSSIILGKNSPIANQIEFFFVKYVFPEFTSKHGYLRARACDTIEKFDQITFADETNLIMMYRHTLACMADPDLPVRVQASLALQTFIRHTVIRETMRQNIPQIMQQLLKLANEVDVDALAGVMEEFVEVFSQELTPFAVALTEQLRDTYLRIIREVLDRNAAKDEPEDAYGDYLDGKSITALGVLQTIGTLILTLESTPDVLLHLETVLMPVMSITLENKLYDLYNEIFEIIDSCTFSAKAISPAMWQAFVLIHKTFKQGAELYLEDMLPALDNFIQYGSQTMLENRSYLDAIFEIVDDIFNDPKVGGVERICGCKLAEALMLNVPGHIDNFVPRFIELAMTALLSPEPKVLSWKIHLMEMVINSVYYNPKMAIMVLESKGWTNRFFSMWFSSMDNFTRVHDKKLSILAIVSLLGLTAGEIPTSVQQGWPRLLQGIVRLFQTLPAAMKNREEVEKESQYPSNDDGDDEDDDEWDQNEQWTADTEEPERDVAEESQAYLNFLQGEATKFNGNSTDYDDGLDEESLLETPLDKVEPYGLFRGALIHLQTTQPDLYNNLTKNLIPEEQTVVRDAISFAEHIAATQNGDPAQQQPPALMVQQQPAQSPMLANGGAR
ncbi:MAG: hypothetical protein M1814_004439 [Vezdaea aestivalis]|nr:MAG: hypothetical protein M1814_004439 [Vezdaea aestivalis]